MQLSIDAAAFAYFIEMVEDSTASGNAITREEMRLSFACACASVSLNRFEDKHGIPRDTLAIAEQDFDNDGRIILQLKMDDGGAIRGGEAIERAVSESATEMFSAAEVAFDVRT